jgi:FG-GAP repeat
LSATDWQGIRTAYSTGRTGAAVGITSQQAYFKASNSGKNDEFGSSVAISGDTVVVGDHGEDSRAVGVNGDETDDVASDSGAAYLFMRSGGAWNPQAYLKASNTTEENDRFGFAVAVSGGTIISGAYQEYSIASGINPMPNDDYTANNSGAAYLFTFPIIEPQVVVPPILNPPVIVPPVVKFNLTVKANRPKFVGWYEKKKRLGKRPVLVVKNLQANRKIIAKFK